MDDVEIGGKRMNFCGKTGCKAVADSGTSLITSPEKNFKDFISALKVDNNDCKDPSKYKKLPDLTFVINGKKYTLHKEDYIYKEYEGDKNPSCADAFLPLDLSPPKGPLWILGDVFMRKFFVVHDRDNKRLGIAERKKNVKTPTEGKITIVPGK